MNTKYYYSDGTGGAIGPIEMTELQQLAASGGINDHTAVIPVGSQTWTTYGEVRTTAAAAAILDRAVAGASSAATTVKSISWGHALFGLLLVVVSGLILPWTLLRRALGELAHWGATRSLPSGASDVPALTHVFIVGRPCAHVLLTTGLLVGAVMSLFGTGPFYYGRLYAYGYNLPAALGGFLAALVAAYFINALVALIYEGLGLLVRMANDLKRLGER